MINLQATTARPLGPVAKARPSGAITDEGIMSLYRGKIGNVHSSSALRRSEIVQIPEERQLSLIYDDKFYSARDRWGLGIVHDMAMFGAVRTQVEIVVNHDIFDTPKFDSKWGTPPDLAAILGCFEAKTLVISAMPDSELLKPRPNGMTRVHEIAGSGGIKLESNEKVSKIGREQRQKLLMLLDQVPNLLGVLSKGGESLARVIWNSGDRSVKRELYERVPLWNWYDNHPSQRKP